MKRICVRWFGVVLGMPMWAGFTFGLAMLSPAYAITESTDTIRAIMLYEGGNLVYVYPTNGVVNPPACHVGNGNYYSFSMSRPMAKSYLAALLTAQAMGSKVQFVGAGACIDQSISDTLQYFVILK